VDPEARVTDEDTAEAYERMLANTERALEVLENRLVCAQATLNAVIDRTRHPHFGAAMTREELVGQFRDYLLEVYADVIGVKTS
jgi:hypothetical protein